jgi:hypothetical protein
VLKVWPLGFYQQKVIFLNALLEALLVLQQVLCSGLFFRKA